MTWTPFNANWTPFERHLSLRPGKQWKPTKTIPRKKNTVRRPWSRCASLQNGGRKTLYTLPVPGRLWTLFSWGLRLKHLKYCACHTKSSSSTQKTQTKTFAAFQNVVEVYPPKFIKPATHNGIRMYPKPPLISTHACQHFSNMQKVPRPPRGWTCLDSLAPVRGPAFPEIPCLPGKTHIVSKNEHGAPVKVDLRKGQNRPAHMVWTCQSVEMHMDVLQRNFWICGSRRSQDPQTRMRTRAVPSLPLPLGHLNVDTLFRNKITKHVRACKPYRNLNSKQAHLIDFIIFICDSHMLTLAGRCCLTHLDTHALSTAFHPSQERQIIHILHDSFHHAVGLTSVCDFYDLLMCGKVSSVCPITCVRCWRHRLQILNCTFATLCWLLFSINPVADCSRFRGGIDT